MNLLPQEPLAPELEDVAERAERGRAFYFMFPGSNQSDRWLQDFEHVDTPGHGGDEVHASGAATGAAEQGPRR